MSMIRPLSAGLAGLCCVAVLCASPTRVLAGPLKAGVAKVDIAHPDQRPAPNDGLWVKALVLTDDVTTIALVTVDAVAIDEIGSIRRPYLANVRAKLAESIKLDPRHLLINASHCHGVVCGEIEQRTVDCVQQAAARLTEVRVGVGTGQENRIMENRRMRLKSGREADVRHAEAHRRRACARHIDRFKFFPRNNAGEQRIRHAGNHQRAWSAHQFTQSCAWTFRHQLAFPSRVVASPGGSRDQCCSLVRIIIQCDLHAGNSSRIKGARGEERLQARMRI